MKILVTGGAGFIASHIVDAYLTQGHEVVVVDRSKQKKYINPQVKFYDMDIQDKELSIVFEKEKPEIINHHAAQTDVPASLAEPQKTIDGNIAGTINLLENAKKYGVKKFIFSSSAAVYGNQKKLPIKEDAPKHMLSPYGVSKYGAELYIQCYARLHRLSYAIFRYANVYGPRQEKGLIPQWIQKLLKNKPCILFGNGKQTRDFVYVSDVVEANVLALKKGNNITVNIGTGTQVTIEEVFTILKKLAGKGELNKQDARQGDILFNALDIKKAKKELDWSPQTSLKDGLKKTFDWFSSL